MKSSEAKLAISVACGGTGGHIFPGLAAAEALKARGHEVTVWLAGKEIETEAVAGWDGPVQKIRAVGLPSGISLKSLRAGFILLRAVIVCYFRLRVARADVMLAMGSYASVGPVVAARMLGIPVILHEANLVPGKAVLLLSRWAEQTAVCFEKTPRYLRQARSTVLTGLPLRKEIVRLDAGIYPEELDRDLFTFMVMGGSLGAHGLNEICSATFCQLQAENVPFQVIHLTGATDCEHVRKNYEEHGVRNMVRAFYHQMPDLYQATDFAICRAGAATCAELAIYGIPSLLVPYPHAAADHQTANANVLAEAGMAEVRAETTLNENELAEVLKQYMTNPKKVAAMSASAKKLCRPDAAEALADEVIRCARDRRN